MLFKKGLLPPKEPLRKKLVWTMKAKGLFLIAVGLYVFLPILIVWLLDLSLAISIILLLIAFCFLLFLFFIFNFLSLIFFWPFDWLVKRFIIIQAKARIGQLGSLKIIGIAGSYGKTTMKEVLLEVLGAKFNAAATPESVNTPVGIARWILRKFDPSLEVAIVEMGEHYKGDVEYLCKIIPPDVAVVTGINEAHLERMKNMETVVSTIFEIVSGTKPKGLVVLNGDDENVVNHCKEYVWPDHRVEFFGKNSTSSKFKVQSSKFEAEKLSWRKEIEGIGEVNVSLLGEYALADVQAAVMIAQKLGMSIEEIKQGIEKIKPVPHRLQPILSPKEVLVIDDSYNGNPHGAAEATWVLSRFVSRRKIYITPGLVEMGKKSADVHREIGRQLAGVADVVILIRNSVTPFIEQGVNSQESIVRKKPEIIWFNTAQEMHVSLSKFVRSGDVVLFQNDWGDQYI